MDSSSFDELLSAQRRRAYDHEVERGIHRDYAQQLTRSLQREPAGFTPLAVTRKLCEYLSEIQENEAESYYCSLKQSFEVVAQQSRGLSREQRDELSEQYDELVERRDARALSQLTALHAAADGLRSAAGAFSDWNAQAWAPGGAVCARLGAEATAVLSHASA
jgi:hypothetical protein